MSITEFEAFIDILKSEDIQLIYEVEAEIYTTDTAQQTLEGVMKDREKSKRNYDKSKDKSKENNFSDEKADLSEDKQKVSEEKIYKVNRSEVNRSELKESEVNGKNSLTFFSEDHFKKIKELYATHTKISDPNRTSHIEPVLKFFSHIPENMTERDIENCIKKTFSALDPGKGVRIDLLCTNIQQNITAKHEQILNKLKKIELDEGKNIRDETDKDQLAAAEKFKRAKLAEYKSLYEQNSEKFTIKEKTKLLEFFTKGNWMQAGEIMEPKIKEFEEIGLV